MGHVRIVEALCGRVPQNSEVTIKGWIRTRRDSKAGLSFLAVGDGSCFDPIQVVAPVALENYQSQILSLTTGCAVVVTGRLVESQGKGQSVEIQAASVELVGGVEDPETYPIAAKRHTFEYLREVAHLRPRTNTFGAVARVRHTLAMAVHRFFDELGFMWIHTPIITASDCEGAGEMFRVSTLDLMNLPRREDNRLDFTEDFFGRETFLTVSGQLDVEAYCLALSRVYTFGPTFRAENSNTSRHLSEFWMIEPEIAFADLNDDADLAEQFLKSIFRTLLEERQDDMAFFEQRIDKECVKRLEQFVGASFERMEYSEAMTVLERAVAKGRSFEFPVGWGVDLQSEHERYLTEEHVGRPVVIVNYPKEIKAFYMRLNDDEKTVAAMDVLAPGIGEIIGGARARRTTRCARPADRRDEARSEAVLVVSRSPPLRHRSARGLRLGIRANDPVRHGNGEHPRRDSVPADAEARGLLRMRRGHPEWTHGLQTSPEHQFCFGRSKPDSVPWPRINPTPSFGSERRRVNDATDSRVLPPLLVALGWPAWTNAQAQYLLVPESTNDQVLLLNAFDGSVVNSSFLDIATPAAAAGVCSTPIEALQVGNEIWVSDQVADRIWRFRSERGIHR